MTATSQRTRLSTSFVSSRLGRSDLRRLTEIVTDGIAAPDVTVTTRHNNVSFRASNIDDLIHDVEAFPGYDDRVPWRSYSAEGSQFTGPAHELTRNVNVDVTEYDVKLDFSGTDHIWVHGQMARAQLFLRNRNGRERQDPYRSSRSAVSTAAAVSLLTWMYCYVVGQAFALGEGDPVWSRMSDAFLTISYWLLIPLLILQTAKFLVRIVRKSSSKGRIDFTRDVPTGSVWQRMDWQTRILFLTLIVATVAAIGTLVSAGADVMKP